MTPTSLAKRLLRASNRELPASIWRSLRNGVRTAGPQAHPPAALVASSDRPSLVRGHTLHPLAVFASVALLLVLCASPAAAHTGHALVGSFDGSDSTAGDFAGVDRIAASQASGNVFVLDRGHNLIDQFDSAGGAAGFADPGLAGANGISVGGFGGDPDVIGKAIQLNSRPFTVIGVMPPDMKLLLKAGSLVGKMPELWTPFAYAEAMRQPRGRLRHQCLLRHQ